MGPTPFPARAYSELLSVLGRSDDRSTYISSFSSRTISTSSISSKGLTRNDFCHVLADRGIPKIDLANVSYSMYLFIRIHFPFRYVRVGRTVQSWIPPAISHAFGRSCPCRPWDLTGRARGITMYRPLAAPDSLPTYCISVAPRRTYPEATTLSGVFELDFLHSLSEGETCPSPR